MLAHASCAFDIAGFGEIGVRVKLAESHRAMVVSGGSSNICHLR